MELLLDTHVLLWWLADDGRLPASARGAIADPEHRVLVSAASIWEMSIKRAAREAPRSGEPARRAGRVRVRSTLPITGPRTPSWPVRSPRHHDDPFDRMLVAQATIEGLTIVTFDER
ncbi:MAG: twitching motility protein PilT [Acidimicrobiia bacterium]|nr:MAG: twitching motility protein PilT [Acidimicrobiia bacterium]